MAPQDRMGSLAVLVLVISVILHTTALFIKKYCSSHLCALS
jgi:hypothetical protein